MYTWDFHLFVYSTYRYSRSRSQERHHSYRKKSRSCSPKSRRSHSRSPVSVRPHSPRSKRSRSRSPAPRSRSKSPPPYHQETKTSSSEKKTKYGQSLCNVTFNHSLAVCESRVLCALSLIPRLSLSDGTWAGPDNEASVCYTREHMMTSCFIGEEK